MSRLGQGDTIAETGEVVLTLDGTGAVIGVELPDGIALTIDRDTDEGTDTSVYSISF